MQKFTFVRILFRLAYEQRVASKQVVDSFIDINLPGYKIKPVAGDGLCMVNSFLEALTHVTRNQTTRKDLISQFRREMLTKF